MKIHNAFRLGLLGGLGVLVAIAIGGTLVSLATILTYVGAALFLALGLDPVVSWLQRHKFPRPLAILTVLVGVLAVFAGLILAIIPVISDQVDRAIRTVPGFVNSFFDGTARKAIQDALPWLNVDDALQGVQQWLNDLDPTQIGGGVLTVGIGIATGITGAIIVLILTLYFVSSLGSLKRGIYRLVPASKRPKFIDLAEQTSTAVGRFVSGQFLLALSNGVLSFIFLTFIFPAFNIPVTYSALLAFIAFLASLIPLVGTVSGAAVITLLVLLFDGAPSVFVVGIYYLVYMQLEAYFLSPRIMSQAVKIPGAVVVIAALAGGTLLGILGALIAIPVAAGIMLVIDQVVVPRQEEL
ncbi:putative PurR-regulated permease PerM [Microbacteriaceae bacterium SG_E_30_P1]|uniref:PurR-regulated permease PerM n=1 Tax=Antiquaquibacter oligotrophicus TaxID=2880260 RepID=A0ABT6KN13_9MICO|nr:AI-2E family transporter [Antiquaquibacter oligotrophicus]MDH6181394.1 putative PurR-regulated permease PerM [Antiquaquibacter oligotrophicus]UDF12914.1 AI-2E family transporter [Antiquaquibacter oligotrophicus]